MDLRISHQPLDKGSHTALDQFADIDPERIVLHLQLRVEFKRFVLEVEVEAGEYLGVVIEKRRWLSSDDAVQAGNPLLTVEQQFYAARREVAVTSCFGGTRVRHPNQQAANGVLAVKGIHESAYLVVVPDVATLELWQRHAAEIDLIENCCDLHS